jgi:hypothetical protein
MKRPEPEFFSSLNDFLDQLGIYLFHIESENKRLREALTKIAEKETCEQGKYNNYVEAYEGIAEFAQAALKGGE